MGTSKTRQSKIEWLKETIKEFFKTKPSGKIDTDKLLAEFAIANNSTARTGEEILRILELVKFIKVDGSNIIKY